MSQPKIITKTGKLQRARSYKKVCRLMKHPKLLR